MQHRDHFYLNGQWQVPISSERMEVLDPATETLCASVPRAGSEDVERAISAAREAFPAWAATPAQRRYELLMAAADEMQRRYDELCDVHIMTLGSPVQVTGAIHVDGPIEGMRYYAERAFRMEQVERKEGVAIVREPIGVCSLINPWNYPLHQLIGKLAPALAAGCTVVAKPAEQTPLQDFIMAEIFDSVGVPPGVFNLVTGVGSEIGPVMAGHPDVDMVSFTGSTAAGIKVAENAAPGVKRVCQELGGKSPLLITEEADINAAVRLGVENVMANTGQTCDALTRMLVPRSQLQKAATLAGEIAREQVVGDPGDKRTTMGPLVSRRQKDTVLRFIRRGLEEGATLIEGGAQEPEGLSRGYYVRPTIFSDVHNDMAIAREEIFGPVLCIIAYDTLEEAIEIANDSDYGLSSAVFARSVDDALPIARRLKAGQCYLQGAEFSFDAPFGGYKLSGNGREWGDEGLLEYAETKALLGA
ncbi:aldehyde dehydrogenase family protein [Halomonas sp. ATCH28]|uniref:Aldehyde dehydrogenase family protein n=1 Tax=Halomonas gemina TaxID=2945105 RepID=A0ABT0T3S8_9GAMM|nr:aldehyde dehydrogenase family protein [Halomonas gemina]MCL7941547.1 aldehyde dehydrogenase family protein [Halomonas gemina]